MIVILWIFCFVKWCDNNLTKYNKHKLDFDCQKDQWQSFFKRNIWDGVYFNLDLISLHFWHNNTVLLLFLIVITSNIVPVIEESSNSAQFEPGVKKPPFRGRGVSCLKKQRKAN